MICLVCSACGGFDDDPCSGKRDPSFSYSAEAFEALGKSLEGKKLAKSELICGFQGPFQFTEYGDTTAYTFILQKYPEVIDTCWGQIYYKRSNHSVVGFDVFCQ